MNWLFFYRSFYQDLPGLIISGFLFLNNYDVRGLSLDFNQVTNCKCTSRGNGCQCVCLKKLLTNHRYTSPVKKPDDSCHILLQRPQPSRLHSHTSFTVSMTTLFADAGQDRNTRPGQDRCHMWTCGQTSTDLWSLSVTKQKVYNNMSL